MDVNDPDKFCIFIAWVADVEVTVECITVTGHMRGIEYAVYGTCGE